MCLFCTNQNDIFSGILRDNIGEKRLGVGVLILQQSVNLILVFILSFINFSLMYTDEKNILFAADVL